MTAYKRGDIVLVPFPFSDQTTVKKRPTEIISSFGAIRKIFEACPCPLIDNIKLPKATAIYYNMP
jgi:hypothetical protein